MGNKSIYELGILAQKGDEMAMLEIIDRKKLYSKNIVLEMKIDTNI